MSCSDFFAEVRKVGAGLPIKRPEPVRFGLGHVLAVCGDVLLVHQLVERRLHGVLAVGETVTAVEHVDDLMPKLRVESPPDVRGGEGDDGGGIEFHVNPFTGLTIVATIIIRARGEKLTNLFEFIDGGGIHFHSSFHFLFTTPQIYQGLQRFFTQPVPIAQQRDPPDAVRRGSRRAVRRNASTRENGGRLSQTSY